jgi:hypothetical protein
MNLESALAKAEALHAMMLEFREGLPAMSSEDIED